MTARKRWLARDANRDGVTVLQPAALEDMRTDLDAVRAEAPYVERDPDGVFRSVRAPERARARGRRAARHDFNDRGLCLCCGRTRNEIALERRRA